MDAYNKKRVMLKLMNIEAGLRNMNEWIEANNTDCASKAWVLMRRIDVAMGDMADKVSDMTEEVRAIKEEAA